jgi:hypothetical protein
MLPAPRGPDGRTIREDQDLAGLGTAASIMPVTNPVESTFASVRLRTDKTKGCLSRATALAMIFKLARSAERHWRRLNGSDRLAEIVRGVRFPRRRARYRGRGPGRCLTSSPKIDHSPRVARFHVTTFVRNYPPLARSAVFFAPPEQLQDLANAHLVRLALPLDRLGDGVLEDLADADALLAVLVAGGSPSPREYPHCAGHRHRHVRGGRQLHERVRQPRGDLPVPGRGIWVYDQWLGQPVHKRLIRFEGGSGGKWGSKSNDGTRFAVIE